MLGSDFYIANHLIIGSLCLVGGGVMIVEWARYPHSRSFQFLWGVGILLLPWYGLPWFLALLGVPLVISELNSLLAMSMSFTFAGLVLIILGALNILPVPGQRPLRVATLLWYVVGLSGMLVYFFSGALESQDPPIWVLITIFFLPLQLLLSYLLVGWYRIKHMITSAGGRVGLVFFAIAAVLQLVVSLGYIARYVQYPPEFWFISMFGSYLVVTIQTMTIILLVAGGLLVRPDCLKVLEAEHSSSS